MMRYFLLIGFLVIGYSSFSQYKSPKYPQNYFRWPTDLKPDIVANLGELRNNHWHMGLDVRTEAVENKRVLAAADGYISYIGIAPLGFGRWIEIKHPNGLSTLYGHLNDFRPDVENYVKQYQYSNESWDVRMEIPANKFPVKKGDFIAYSGNTGASGGPHIHWEVIDTKSDKRLNPTLFGTPIVDNIAPTISRLLMYDRNNSVYYQSPQSFSLAKKSGIYFVAGDTIKTNLEKISFAIQAYDTRNGTANQDGIYSAVLYVNDEAISSFYVDSISYADTRYMNAHIDYKMKYNGGAYVQHVSKLPGDRGGIYRSYNGGLIYNDPEVTQQVRIVVSDASGNKSTIQFYVKKNDNPAPVSNSFEWQPNKLNRLFKYDFEVYMPMYALYDKMNATYTRTNSSDPKSVSAKHSLGDPSIPVQDYFEIRIKPTKIIVPQDRNKVVIKYTAKNTSYKKAEWREDWLSTQHREFGSYEAIIDDEPPTINSLGNDSIINLNKATRIVFTPKDNTAIASFRATLNGEWLRFTNNGGRTWIYKFDEKCPAGEHVLSVTVTDIAGNKTTRSWRFVRGTSWIPPQKTKEIAPKEEGEKKAVVVPKKTTPTPKTPQSTTKNTAIKKDSKNTTKTTSSKISTTQTKQAASDKKVKTDTKKTTTTKTTKKK